MLHKDELNMMEWPPYSSIYFAKDIPTSPYKSKMAHQESIKFIISQDGTVTEEVMGCSSGACINLTTSLEERLGDLERREYKPEYYQQQTTVTENVTLQSD